MLELGVDLILFSVGDGTAKDIYEAINGEIPVLGIPAGVKINSGVYAINPVSAGELACRYLCEGAVTVKESEVMDINEEAFRDNRISSKLYGYLKVPYEKTLIQGSKEGSSYREEFILEAIAQEIVDDMEDNTVYIIGPGSTTKTIVEKLGLEKTLLGVDVVQVGELLALDANESRILELIEGSKVKIIVTVIGGQGFIFGRGNQQISPEVIRRAGKKNILVVATPEKLASLKGGPSARAKLMNAEAPSGFSAPIGMLSTSAIIKAAGSPSTVGNGAGTHFKPVACKRGFTIQSPSSTMATSPSRKGSGCRAPMGLIGRTPSSPSVHEGNTPSRRHVCFQGYQG
jgi:predicted polyphosphate/ATP-dependent NAD kinase